MDKIGSKNCGSGREILGYIRGVANQERCGDNSDWHTCRYIYTWNCKMGEGTGSKSRYEAHWVAVYCDSYTSHPSSFRGGIYQRHRS